MPFQSENCSTISFICKKNQFDTKYHLKVAEGGKYLGVHINNNLSLLEHIRQNYCQGNTVFFIPKTQHAQLQIVRVS